MANRLAPTPVSIHYDGGPGLATDAYALMLSTPHNVLEFPDVVATANSGVLNVEGAFTMSYESLTPIVIAAAAGSLVIDARGLPGMTQMTVTDLGGDVFMADGDGGFERTTFSGFDQFLDSLRDRVPMLVGRRGQPGYSVVQERGRLTIPGNEQDNRFEVGWDIRQLTVGFDESAQVTFRGVSQLVVDTAAGNDSVRVEDSTSLSDPVRISVNGRGGDDDFHYVGVKRALLFLEQSVQEGTDWVIFPTPG